MKIVIIGAVACGTKAAAKLRRLDSRAEIVLIDKAEVISYGACGLPYYLSGEIDEVQKLYMSRQGIRDKAYFENIKKIDRVLLKTEAVEIDRPNRQVWLEDLDKGEIYAESYDKLIIATGAQAVMPPIKGKEALGVFNLKNPADGKNIRTLLESGNIDSAVVVGAGLIGIEIAEALQNYNLTTRLVDMADQVLPALLDSEMAEDVHHKLQENGVKLMLNSLVEEINMDSRMQVESVVINGETIASQLVILAAGFQPNTVLAKKAGLKTAPNGGIIVDEYLRTSDKDVYAGGDCVMNRSLISNELIYLPLGDLANIHGRIIARNIIDGDVEKFAGVTQTAITRFKDLNIGSVGISAQKAAELGFQPVSVLIKGSDKAGYYPDHKKVKIKLTADKNTGKILGAQITGSGDVAKLLNTLSLGLHYGIDISTMSQADLAYSPVFAPVLDNLIVAANVLQKQIKEG